VVDRKLVLFSAPDAGEGMNLESSTDFLVHRLAEDGDWSKITFEAGVRFVGWVKTNSLNAPPPRGGSGGSGGFRSRAPRVRFPKRVEKIGTVARETPLYLGKSGDAVREIGRLEAGAVIRLGAASGELVAFRFDVGLIHAAEGFTLFVEPAAVTGIHDEDRGGTWKAPPLPVFDEEAD
jgi:hypothetical protein